MIRGSADGTAIADNIGQVGVVSVITWTAICVISLHCGLLYHYWFYEFFG